jgi:hypothetical protein
VASYVARLEDLHRPRRVGLYVSAAPMRDTVDAHRCMGAIVLETPDPAFSSSSPNDTPLLVPMP